MTTEPLKVYCRSCGKPTNHTVRSKPADEISSSASRGVGGESGEEYWIVACAGCNTVSFREVVSLGDKKVENLYPAPTIRKAKDDFEGPTSRVPPDVLGIYRATMSAFNSGRQNQSCFILCAGGIRCMLELICSDLRIEGSTLEAKIDGLNKAGHLTPTHTQLLHDARFLGNDALHEGRVPDEATLDTLLKLFEDTVNDLYIRVERFNEGEMLDAEVIEVSDKGTVVRVGTSTRSMIPVSEGGGPPIDSASKAQKIGDTIKVKVLSGRDAQLLQLSKKAADAAIKKEQDDQRQKAEEDRAYWAAFKQVRRGDLLDGVVTRLCNNGLEIDVIQGGVHIPGWVPMDEYEPQRQRDYRRKDRLPLYVLKVIPAVGQKRECVIVSHREGNVETYYRQAEAAFRHCTMLRGLVTEIAKDGTKVFVEIGLGCVGQVLQSELGAGDGDAIRVGGLINRMIAVRVTSAPDPKRRAHLQLSHRTALERQQRLTDLKKLPPPPPLIGKVSRVFPWGAVVSVNGTDGVMLKVDMAGQKLSEAAEIQVEIVRLEPNEGYLGLKAVFTAAVSTSDNVKGEAADDMADDADMEEANLQPSERFQADGNEAAETLNNRDGIQNVDEGPKIP